MTFNALGANRAAMQRHEFSHQRQPYAGSFVRARQTALDAMKALEDVRQLVRRDTNSRVGNG
jgi:hypothetical protein